MVHVHGARAQQLSARTAGMALGSLVAVAVDVGKASSVAMACDFTGQVLVSPFEFAMTRAGIVGLVARVEAGLPAQVGLVRVGVEATGHYHRPITTCGLLPESWQVVELNPGHVAMQRRTNGQRGVKTDHVDLTAITDLLLIGRGSPVIASADPLVELAGWVAHRARRVAARTAVRNQLLGQLDRAFPGADQCLSRLLDAQVGRLVIAQFSDPARLARLGPERFRAFAARRGIRVTRPVAQRLVDAAKDALPTAEAGIARHVLAADLDLLERLDAQVADADDRINSLLPATRFQVLTTTPGWGVIRVAVYAAAVGNPDRWPSHRQLYRAAGLTPSVYASAGKRRDGGISREGSVALRHALLGLGMGLRSNEPAGRRYAATLRERGKPGGIILCALAHRANKIAFAMLRDQTPYNPTHWS